MDVAPHLHDLAHEFVAHNVARLHSWHETVIEVQIGAANRRGCDLYDGVLRVENLRVRYLLYPHRLFGMPTIRSHDFSPWVSSALFTGRCCPAMSCCSDVP